MIRNAGPSLTALTRRIKLPFVLARSESSTPTHQSTRPTFTPPSKPNGIVNSHPHSKRAKPRVGGTRPDKDGVPFDNRRLTPYALWGRLSKLCAADKLDEAIETLKSMPLDAQNTIVWNSIIREAGRAERYKLAFELYIEMKRRGLNPDNRTFATIMSVFSKVDSWSNRTLLLSKVHNVYDHYLTYLAAVRKHNPQSPELSASPINTYLIVLSKAGEHQRMFDVYNSLESNHLSPDQYTYTIMLHSFALKQSAANRQLDESQAKDIRERTASDARLIWRQMMKRIEQGHPITIDAQLVGAAIQSLAPGRPADQIIAFDILRDHVGLAKPGEVAPPPTFQLTRPLLSDVLWLCNTAQKYRLSIHFFQQLTKTNPTVLDRGHMDHVLAAYGALSAMGGSSTEPAQALQTLEWMLAQSHLTSDRARRPGLPSYTLALVACWRGKDWDSALRIFELMTGFAGTDFADGTTNDAPAPAAPPASTKGSLAILPDAAFMSCLVRAALASGDPAHMRQCARIVQRLGLSQHFTAVEDAAHREGKRAAPRLQKDASFYAYKVASEFVQLVDVLVPRKAEDSAPLTGEQRGWVNLRTKARSYLFEQRHRRPQVTPLLEESPLGSEEGLAAMDEAVAWNRISREQKSK